MYKLNIPSMALALSVVLFLILGELPDKAVWGYNHLAFLSVGWRIAATLVALVAIPLSFVRTDLPMENRITGALNRLIWDSGILWRILVLMVLGATFWTFRSNTHFLGDGYTLRADFGLPDSYVIKWTATGASILVRSIQSLFGLYNRLTSQVAFKLVSVVSGLAVVMSFVGIARQLSSEPLHRLFIASTLFFSGTLLLFFGYIEYYPLLWAAACLHVYLALRYLRKSRGLAFVMASFLFALILHIEAVILVGGLAAVIRHRLIGEKYRRFSRSELVVVVSCIVLFLIAITIVGNIRNDFAYLLLPWLRESSRPGGQAILSLTHLLDIGSEVLLVLPGFFYLCAVANWRKPRCGDRSISQYLAAASATSLGFLAIANPALGMGRDWDLMSLTLLCPALWLALRSKGYQFRVSQLASYGLITLLATLSFVTVAAHGKPSEDRYASLLDYYGRTDEGGWKTLAKYYANKGNTAKADSINSEIAKLFPETSILDSGFAALRLGEYMRADSLGKRVLGTNRFASDAYWLIGESFQDRAVYDSSIYYLKESVALSKYDAGIMNQLAQSYLYSGQYAQARLTFLRARRLDPSMTSIVEGIALLCIRQKDLSAADAWADTLFVHDPNSSGGYLIRMTISISRGEMTWAKQDFEQFLKYGRGRSDYRSIVQAYGPEFR